jgi:3-phosphoshikimate 1-carboxyvinyltransferase
LFSSIAKGKSKAYNLLLSEDVLAAINAVKKLGAQVKLNKNNCTIIGNGPSGYKYKKNITINSENSGNFRKINYGSID